MSNNKYKVLIVEDEANICSFIETLLTTNDYQALVAHTCTMGLTLFASHNPDLVILDLGLPDRDGLELIRTVRQKYMTPIIVLSARTDEMDKIEALDLGANDYITKPFGTGELLARVRVALRLNRYSRTGDAASGGGFQIRPFSDRAGIAPAGMFRSRRPVGQQDGKVGEIVVQNKPGCLPIPPGKGMAQSAVHGAEPVQFPLWQILHGGPHISEHQNTRTMVKDSPPRALTRRSYQTASSTPTTAPSTATVYCMATLAVTASITR